MMTFLWACYGLALARCVILCVCDIIKTARGDLT